jgi:acylphosphatase
VHLFISGFVQGVGFRAFIKHQANNLGIAGWVKNIPDGRVEAVAEGEREKLTKLINFCRQGPAASQVKSVEVFWEEKEGLEGFKIIKNKIGI